MAAGTSRTVAAAALAWCIAAGVAQAAIVEQLVIPDVQYPTNVVHAGDGSGRLFVTEQGGEIWVWNGTTKTLFLDLTAKIIPPPAGERGLLGLAFDPQYETNGRFYVFYTLPVSSDMRLERYLVSADPNVANPASAALILDVTDYQSSPGNHRSGQLAFGPDGYLYVGTGDGGLAADLANPAQNKNNLLGKVLRLDVSAGGPGYAIPPTNPFVDADGRDEVWAMGLRNPWRFSFDTATGDLFIADVGGGSREEVNYQPAGLAGGRNYGWPCKEGTLTRSIGCAPTEFTDPVLEYPHGTGDCSITGGFVYHGPSIPSWLGRYVYGDFCSGVIRLGTEGAGGTWTATVGHDSDKMIRTFGLDEAGNLYFGSHLEFAVYRLLEVPILAISDVAVAEGDAGQTPATFTVTTSHAIASAQTVAWTAQPLTATAGADYVAVSGTVTFPAGDATPRTVTVQVKGDALDEANETFRVVLSSPVNAAIADGTGVGTILDDDPTPILSLRDATVTEGNAGTVSMMFAADLSAPSGRTTGFTWRVMYGTAGAADVTAASGIVTIPAGAAVGTFSVPVLGDTLDEPHEAFLVELSAPVNVTLARTVGQGTILDDDGRPAVCRPIHVVPFTITAQGRYCLTRNLSTAQPAGAAVTVATDFVVLDLQGFKLGGGGAGTATEAFGVYALDRHNVIVRNGNVRGFLRGVFLEGASSQAHLVERIQADENTLAGVHVEGAGVTVRRNAVVATGGSTAFGADADAFGIVVSGPGARVLDNDVSDTEATGAGSAVAVHLALANGAVVEKNRVSSSPAGTPGTTGIFAASGDDIVILDNRLTGFEFGIVFDTATGKYRRNLTSGVTTPFTGGTDAGGNE